MLRYIRRKEKEHKIFTRLSQAIWTFRIIINGWTTITISVRMLKTAIGYNRAPCSESDKCVKSIMDRFVGVY